MTNFNAYEGFKMASITCYRTLYEVDGMEVSSKLLWCTLSLYQAITYAMLFKPGEWNIEKNSNSTYTLTEAIEKSWVAKNKACFVSEYHNPNDQTYNVKIHDIENIRNNVMHANARELKKWEGKSEDLVGLIDLCLKIINEITQINNGQETEESKKMRQWWQSLEVLLDRRIMDL